LKTSGGYKMGFSWTCPSCNRIATITDRNMASGKVELKYENAHGPRIANLLFIVCPNSECSDYTLTAGLYEAEYAANNYDLYQGKCLRRWNLIPFSNAKSFPDYIPEAIINDYEEACLIKDLSPKASATLSRRCLQGIIRDFWGVSKRTLYDEIEAIKDRIDPLTWSAIDSVRSIGNIGAHMEKDINIIIDVEPSEATFLVELIEILINDWYITRYERQQRLQSIIDIKLAKDELKSQQTNP